MNTKPEIETAIKSENKIADYTERQQALDHNRSFIVQAPAGSGKTELLTQRYLVLLSHANKVPEEIIAVTFTRKAAAEMRARIIKALENATQNSAPIAPHALITWQLARQVIQRDQQLNWKLLQNPNRLRIQTIDSLCGHITTQMPVLSKFGAQPNIADNAEVLYTQAARALLETLGLETLADNVTWVDALIILLLHLHNDHAKAERLLVNMLACRDQWLAHIVSGNPRQALEQTLEHVISEHLTKLINHLTPEFVKECVPLMNFAAANLEQDHSPIKTCLDLSELPSASAEALAQWSGIANLLLKKDKQWRKSFTRREGFPAPSSAKNTEDKNLYGIMKQRMQTFISALMDDHTLRQLLQQTLELPPAEYTDEQWKIIEALVELLPILCAQLQIFFQQSNKVDHTEIALQASAALGQHDNPTDLALALDYKIQHLLVDEFQDTSISQFQLLQKLTAGWQNGDGRTLFLVGDPMQSIYRFRKAEVGIFLQAKQHGIGDIKLQPLNLCVNFRSQAPIIEWLNQTFKHVLPQHDDLATGAIHYSSSTAAKISVNNDNQRCQDTAVVVHPLLQINSYDQKINDNTPSEAETIVSIIKKTWQQNPEFSIAILVMSRNHLLEIIPALQKAQINYRAIDIEKLAHKSVVQDLLALTKALLYLSDRTAWLAILRAPWCGLTLADLLAVADNQQQTIWQNLYDHNREQGCNNKLKLSEDGYQRLQRIFPIIQKTLAQRRRGVLADWIEQCWLMLGGPACVHQETDLQDAKAFFQLLTDVEYGGDILDFELLEKRLLNLSATVQSHAGHAVDIMTIHKSKGLEFDTVILPSLDKKTRQDDHQLLMWQEIPVLTDHPIQPRQIELLLAPIKASAEDDPIYDYLRLQEQKKSHFEMGRLLYVATTRAKQSLHLLAHCNVHPEDHSMLQKPNSNSLLECLWPQLEKEFMQALKHKHSNSITANDSQDNQHSRASSNYDSSEKQNNVHRQLRRLTINWQMTDWLSQEWLKTSSDIETTINQNTTFQFNPENSNRRHIGTVIHKLLQQLSLHNATINNWKDICQTNIIQQSLMALGVSKSTITNAIQLVEQAIFNTLSDPRGQWILDSKHLQAQSEYALTANIHGKIQHVIIDRTFVEHDVRWIIDYKTVSTNIEPEKLNNFLKQQKRLYQMQLEDYAYVLRSTDARPIRLGLYFPLLNAWTEWAFSG